MKGEKERLAEQFLVNGSSSQAPPAGRKSNRRDYYFMMIDRWPTFSCLAVNPLILNTGMDQGALLASSLQTIASPLLPFFMAIFKLSVCSGPWHQMSFLLLHYTFPVHELELSNQMALARGFRGRCHFFILPTEAGVRRFSTPFL